MTDEVIRIRLDDAEINRKLGLLVDAMDDMTPVMQEIGEYGVASTRDRFGTGLAPDGIPWAPKSETTIETYKRRGDRVDYRPLFGPSGRLSTEISYVAQPMSVEWGSSLIYAAAMQFGAAQGQFGARTGRTKPSEKRQKSQDYFFPIPWGNIPARPFLGLSDADRSAIIDIVTEWLDRTVQA